MRMKRLSEVLDNSMPAGFNSYLKIKRAWNTAVGESIAFLTTPGALKDGTLNVAVHDQTWLSEIGFLTGELVARLRENGLDITTINFYYKQRKLTDAEYKNPQRKSMTEKEKKFADRLIDTIEGDELRESFRKAIYGYFTLYSLEDYLNC